MINRKTTVIGVLFTLFLTFFVMGSASAGGQFTLLYTGNTLGQIKPKTH